MPLAALNTAQKSYFRYRLVVVIGERLRGSGQTCLKPPNLPAQETVFNG